MENEEHSSGDTATASGSVQNTRCPCRLSLPQPNRPLNPVNAFTHEVQECFPCWFESTWPLQKLPFLKWLLQYNLRWLLSDVIAGLTVGLMVVPQALAYANIANLPPSVSNIIDVGGGAQVFWCIVSPYLKRTSFVLGWGRHESYTFATCMFGSSGLGIILARNRIDVGVGLKCFSAF